MKRSFFAFILISIMIISCKKQEKSTQSDYYRGRLVIETDGSFKSITEALAEGYMLSYPEAKITVKEQKEDLAFLDLLHGKEKLIVMSRALSTKEQQAYKEQTDLDYNPSKFAADAVLFVVPSNSSLSSINYDEIKAGLLSSDKKFIFDGTNSSNLNFVAEKLGKKPSDLKYSIINGNENLIDQLNKYPDHIGVISLNTISRIYNKETQELKSKVKILPIIFNGKSYDPSIGNLREMTYPFTRVLYFLHNEGGFGVANGFMRFSCTQLGQIIVSKEGLQPYNVYKREVQMD